MYSTLLTQESGVQFTTEIVDNEASILSNKNVIVGSFKRGRTDQPMRIDNQNVRAILGHEPWNPDYVAVLEALKTEIAFVYVMRLVEPNVLSD